MGLTEGGREAKMGVTFGMARRKTGRNGRQDKFIPLHPAKLSFSENLRNFHNRRHAVAVRIRRTLHVFLLWGFSGPSEKTQGECAFSMPESTRAE